MTLDMEKTLVMTAIKSRADEAVAALVQAETIDEESRCIAQYLWNVLEILDLLDKGTARLASLKLDELLDKAKKDMQET